MDASELTQLTARGEDSTLQFKVDVRNATSLAGEMVAFANCGGGTILIGVDDNGKVVGLDAEAVKRINQLVASVATDNVRPSINPRTENIPVSGRVVMVITIRDGLSKPYMDNQGTTWVKSGSDKRRVTSREELQRMFQQSQLVHADAVPVNGSSESDIDREYLRTFFAKHFGSDFDEEGLPLSQALSNMNLLAEGALNLSCVLLFSKHTQRLLPAFHVKAVAYPGVDIHASEYLDSQDFHGNLEAQYRGGLGFLKRNTRHPQNGQDVNSLGVPEIPYIVFEELLANALIHRDYFTSAPVRIFVFDDRIEIISPGHLPNNLTVANIKSGNSNIRNPILASYATRVLPYRGLGNGILRAIKEYPDIDFKDDRDGNLFHAVIHRRLQGA